MYRSLSSDLLKPMLKIRHSLDLHTLVPGKNDVLIGLSTEGNPFCTRDSLRAILENVVSEDAVGNIFMLTTGFLNRHNILANLEMLAYLGEFPLPKGQPPEDLPGPPPIGSTVSKLRGKNDTEANRLAIGRIEERKEARQQQAMVISLLQELIWLLDSGDAFETLMSESQNAQWTKFRREPHLSAFLVKVKAKRTCDALSEIRSLMGQSVGRNKKAFNNIRAINHLIKEICHETSASLPSDDNLLDPEKEYTDSEITDSINAILRPIMDGAKSFFPRSD